MGRCSGSRHALCQSLLLLLLLLGAGSCMPTGAPASACSSLRPVHGSHLPQEGTAPFRLTAEPAAGGSSEWLVTLAGDRPFRGLLMQARAASGDDATPLGQFEQTGTTRLVDCSGQPQSALTHSSPIERDSLEVAWRATNVSGPVQFVATVVEDYRTWWQEVRSETVTVTAAAADTETAVRSAPEQESSVPDVEGVYSGCFTEYGCFGSPAGCEATKACDVLFTYVASDAGMKMGLMAKQEDTYAAIGFSQDDEMTSDGVIICANSADGLPAVYYAYNPAEYCIGKSGPNPDGTSALQSWEKDGYFMCDFIQEFSLVIPDGGGTYDLEAEHFLLVATGELQAAEPLDVGYHGGKRVASAGAVNLSSFSPPETAGVPPLIKAHGAMMLIAWIGTAGIGILSAQFFRDSWVGKKLLGTDIWFTIHRSLMVLTAVCTWLGFIFICVELEGLDLDHNHNIVGFVVFLISILQVVGALLRPHPGTRFRPVFAWGHRLGGVSAYLLAVTALLLAQPLAKVQLPRYWFWLVVAAVIVHLTVSVLLLVVDRYAQKESYAGSQVSPIPSAPAKSEAPGSPIRKAVLVFYSLIALGFVVALVTVLIVSTA